jgi:predicted transcriptional regulator
MRNTRILSVSLPADMLSSAVRLAQEENRTMSELVREALRTYERTRPGWQDVFAFGEANAKRLGLQGEGDVVRIVRESRRARSAAAGGRRSGAR